MLILSSQLRLGLPRCLFPSGFPTIPHLPWVLLTRPSHPPSFHHADNVWWKAKKIKLLVMQHSPACCSFSSLSQALILSSASCSHVTQRPPSHQYCQLLYKNISPVILLSHLVRSWLQKYQTGYLIVTPRTFVISVSDPRRSANRHNPNISALWRDSSACESMSVCDAFNNTAFKGRQFRKQSVVQWSGPTNAFRLRH
jgi:hypothetical protein